MVPLALSVDRTNVNYLAMQTGSIYICYHVHSDRLLVRRVDDVICEYENKNKPDMGACQSTITVRFDETLDCDFQHLLKDYVVACARSSREQAVAICQHSRLR